MRVIELEDENRYLKNDLEVWESLFAKKTPEERRDDRDWIVCSISKLQNMLCYLDELQL